MATELKDVTAYILLRHREEWEQGLSNTRLNNVIFLCDWSHAVRYGCQITAIHWRLGKHADSGVYVSDIESVIENRPDLFRIRHEPEERRYFSLKESAFQSRFGDEARETLDLVISETKHLSHDEFMARVGQSYPVSSSSLPQQRLDLRGLAAEYKSGDRRKRHSASVTTALPEPDEFNFAVLDWANGFGRKFSRRDIVEAMLEYFNPTPARKEQLIRRGGLERFKDRVRWATVHLHGAGMLCRDRALAYEITNFGRKELAASNGKFATAYLSGLEARRSSPSFRPPR